MESLDSLLNLLFTFHPSAFVMIIPLILLLQFLLLQLLIIPHQSLFQDHLNLDGKLQTRGKQALCFQEYD